MTTTAFQQAVVDLRANREFVFSILEHDPKALEWASATLCDDKLLVAAACVKHEQRCMRMSAATKADLRIVQLVNNNLHPLRWASDALRSDAKFVLALFDMNPNVLFWAAKQ